MGLFTRGTGLSYQSGKHAASASLTPSFSGESGLNTCIMFPNGLWDEIIQFFSIVTDAFCKHNQQ